MCCPLLIPNTTIPYHRNRRERYWIEALTGYSQPRLYYNNWMIFQHQLLMLHWCPLLPHTLMLKGSCTSQPFIFHFKDCHHPPSSKYSTLLRDLIQLTSLFEEVNIFNLKVIKIISRKTVNSKQGKRINKYFHPITQRDSNYYILVHLIPMLFFFFFFF